MKPAAIPQRNILSTLEHAGSRAYTLTQLADLLGQHRLEWHLPKSFSAEDFARFLQEKGELRRITLSSPDYSDLTRYVWGKLSAYQVALTVRKGAFLSHGTAAFLHDLTDQLAHTIFVNAEQSAKPANNSSLSQEGIDRAFKAPQRTSNLIYEYDEWRITVLAGKNTGRMEVSTITGPNEDLLEATKLERTLVDLTVRPAYAGGPHLVLEAFKRAKDRVSTNVLLATLKKFGYVYPYHQAIGFYMERAGYPADKLSRFSSLKMPFKFYLTHGLKDPEFVPQWNLFVPRKF